MRRLVVLLAVALLVLVACDPPPLASPGSGGSDVADVVDPSVVGTPQGSFVSEDWHYVGEAGEPAFGSGWANAAADRNLAFRIREAGIVDIQGYIENTNAPSAPSSPAFFTLPSGYRPSADTFQGLIAIESDEPSDGYIAASVSVSGSGAVFVSDIDNDPVFSSLLSGAYAGVAQYVRIQGFFFLDPSDAP